MASMKILYIARGGRISGSQRQLLNLLHRLDRAKYEPLVICSEGGDLADQLARINVETLVHPRFLGWRTTRYVVHRYFFRTALLRECRGRNIHLIHCSYPWFNRYSLYLAKQLNCPCVSHLRGPVPQSMIKKHGFTYADRLIAVSLRTRKDLINAGISADKISLIYDGIDAEYFCPPPSGNHPFRSNGEFVFGLVGRIEPEKFQMEFVRAACLLAARRKTVKFLMVGQPWDVAYTRKVKHSIEVAKLSDRIILSGRCENMPQVLGGFDVLVSLSGGSVMYEAMACGVPVLSAGFTRKADAVHVIDGYNAMLLDNRDPQNIANAMEQLLTEKAYRQTLAGHTRPHVLQNLADGVMAAQTQAVYEQMLDGHLTDASNTEI